MAEENSIQSQESPASGDAIPTTAESHQIDESVADGDVGLAEHLTEGEHHPRFEDWGLKPELLEALLDMGYVKPMEVQSSVFERFTSGADLMVQSRTGSGKTAAFGIPIAQMLDSQVKGAQTLVLAPTRELALQVAREMERIIVTMPDLSVVAVYGGAAIGPQIKALKDGAQIVVGTPGRVLDHLRRKTFDPRAIRILVLDECDEMLSMGFQEEIENIISFLPPPVERQTMLFSATIPDEIERIGRRHMREPEKISLSDDSIGALQIAHYYYVVSGMARTRDLLKVMKAERPESAIVFCNTREDTSSVAKYLTRHGYDAEAISSDLSQRDRERVMKRMRDGNLHFLVATDIAARGIDISGLSHVINFTFPESPEVYVHRTGRTGRAGKEGIALSLVGPREIGSFYYLKLIYKIIPEERELPSNEELVALQQGERYMEVVEKVTEEPGAEYLELARRLWQSAHGERVIGALLKRLLTERARPVQASPAVEHGSERASEREQESAERERPEREEDLDGRRRRRRGRNEEDSLGRGPRDRSHRRGADDRGDRARRPRETEERADRPRQPRETEERADRARQPRETEERADRPRRPRETEEEQLHEQTVAPPERAGEVQHGVDSSERETEVGELAGILESPAETTAGDAERHRRRRRRRRGEEAAVSARMEEAETGPIGDEVLQDLGEVDTVDADAEPSEELHMETEAAPAHRPDQERDRPERKRRRRRRGGAAGGERDVERTEPSLAGIEAEAEEAAPEASREEREPRREPRREPPRKTRSPVSDSAREFWEAWAEDKDERIEPAPARKGRERGEPRAAKTEGRERPEGNATKTEGRERPEGNATKTESRKRGEPRAAKTESRERPNRKAGETDHANEASSSKADHRPSREPESESEEEAKGPTTRLFVNLGKREDASADDIRNLLAEALGPDGERIGTVALRNTHCYVRVPEDLADRLIKACEGMSYKDRDVVIERARR